jgi:hypothetical protein
LLVSPRRVFPEADLPRPRPDDEEPRYEDSFRIPLRSEVH